MRRLPLDISFLPTIGCNNNARIEMGADWQVVRMRVFSDNEWTCIHCGKESPDLEAHEVWEFREVDATTVEQKLVDIRPVCNRCHLCHHVGMANRLEMLPLILDHFAKVRELPEDNQEEITANAVDDAIKIAAPWNSDRWKLVTLNIDFALDIFERKPTPLLPPPERSFGRKIDTSKMRRTGTWNRRPVRP